MIDLAISLEGEKLESSAPVINVQPEKAYRFSAKHLEYMKARAISPQIAWNEGVRSLDEQGVRQLVGAVGLKLEGGGLGQPYTLPDGHQPAVYGRVQLDERVKNGRKTASPRLLTEASQVPAYFPTTCSATSNDPLYICEGPLKALSLVTAGHAHSVGLGGVDVAFFERGSSSIQPIWAPYLRPERPINITFDAGVMMNPMVATAAAKIARALLDRQIPTKFVLIPRHEGEDQGPDDFLARYGKDAFADLVRNAREADPVVYARSIAAGTLFARQALEDLLFLASVRAGGPAVEKDAVGALSAYFKAGDLKKVTRQRIELPLKVKAKTNNSTTGTTCKIGRGAPWEKDLLRSGGDDGAPDSCLQNARLVLVNDPTWQCLAFNELSNSIVVRGPLPAGFLAHAPDGAWCDADDTMLVCWLQAEWGIHTPLAQVRSVVELAARARSYHPVRQWLEKCSWDGVNRLDKWLGAYFGAARHDDYTSKIGRYWLIGMVARAYEPGCQLDYCLVLEGAQGDGKSSGLRALVGPDWHSDSLSDVGSVEAAKQLQGKWLICIEELDAFRRADVSAIKKFISARSDFFRPSYARSARDHFRGCGFAATTNKPEYLQDSTGARRFWPITSGVVNVVCLERDRELIWAEAVHAYKAGEKWHPSRSEEKALFAPQQAARRIADPWEPLIEEYAAGREYVRIETILTKVLGVTTDKQTRASNERVIEILRYLGWGRSTRRVDDEEDPAGPKMVKKCWTRTAGAAPKVEPEVKKPKPVEPVKVSSLDYAPGAIPIFKGLAVVRGEDEADRKTAAGDAE